MLAVSHCETSGGTGIHHGAMGTQLVLSHLWTGPFTPSPNPEDTGPDLDTLQQVDMLLVEGEYDGKPKRLWGQGKFSLAVIRSVFEGTLFALLYLGCPHLLKLENLSVKWKPNHEPIKNTVKKLTNWGIRWGIRLGFTRSQKENRRETHGNHVPSRPSSHG